MARIMTLKESVKKVHVPKSKYMVYPVFGESPRAKESIEAAENLAQALADEVGHKDKVYVFIVQGSSGMFMATVALHKLISMGVGARIIYKNKSGEFRHDDDYPDMIFPDEEVVFIDDLMATGKTLKELWDFAIGIQGFNHRVILCLPRYYLPNVLDLNFTPKLIIGQDDSKF